MKQLGVGIIGLKHQHPRWYYPLWKYLPEYKLVAIADEDEKFLQAENELFKLDAYSDYRQLLERDDIDVVIIWQPHSQMPRTLEDAAKAGKHAIVEKPCGADVAGVRKIVRVAQQHPSLKISSPYCWRDHAVSIRIKQVISQGLIGEVTAFNARLNAGGAHRYVRDNALWMLRASEGGGPMWNLGVHWLDYIRWVSGGEFVSGSGVFTPSKGEPARDIEDNAQGIWTLSSGQSASIDVSYSITPSYPGARDIYFSARGTAGSLAWEPAWTGVEDELLLVNEKNDPKCQRIRIVSEQVDGYGQQMGRDWLRQFAQCIFNDTPPAVTPDDMLRAVEAAQMAIDNPLRASWQTT